MGHAKSARREANCCPQVYGHLSTGRTLGLQLPTGSCRARPSGDESARLAHMGLASIARVITMLLLVLSYWSLLLAGRAAAADWIAPLPEPFTVTKAFQPPDNPYGAGHRGVDIAATAGQDVRAAGTGTVVYAGALAGRGVVSIQHADGLRTTYEPLSAAVSAGVSVSAGQVIGTVDAGHPGCPIPACLHWGLTRGDSYFDPLLLLSTGPVRLLPRYRSGVAALGLRPAVTGTLGTLAVGTLGAGLISRYRPPRHGGGPGGRPP